MLSAFQKHVLIFLIGCIGTRSLFVYLASRNDIYLPLYGKLALLPGLGFLILYFFNLRQTGMESFVKEIWWNHLRPLHGLLYLLFAYLAINQHKHSWIVLLIDVIIGLLAFINKYAY